MIKIHRKIAYFPVLSNFIAAWNFFQFAFRKSIVIAYGNRRKVHDFLGLDFYLRNSGFLEFTRRMPAALRRRPIGLNLD